jgi:hypothetical protein
MRHDHHRVINGEVHFAAHKRGDSLRDAARHEVAAAARRGHDDPS